MKVHMKIILIIFQTKIEILNNMVQLAGAAKYTNCISAEG